MAEARLEQLISRLEQATSRLEKVSIGGKGGASASSGAAEEVAASVTGWDEFIQASVQPFLDVSKKIGGDLNQVADAVKDAFAENRKIVVIASLAKKPSEQELIALIKPLFAKVEGLQALRSKLRGDFADHVAGVAEGFKCLEWVGVNGTTVSYIKEMVAAAQFYTNKVLMKYKKTDQTHVDWVNALKKIIEDLAAYVKEYHTTGLTFNPKGKTVAEAQSGAAASAPKAAPAGGAPLPPPPPPAIDIPAPAPAASSGGSGGGMDAVFEAIKGGNITSGLKKVTKEMKSKNNPNKSSIVTEVGSKKATTTVKNTEEKMGTPRVELVENKWVIEYQVGNKEIVLDNVQLKHSVYIYACKDSLIQIKGKVNNVALDKCTKTGVIHEAVVASVELVNCKSVQIQCNDAVPTVSIDKTDGVQIYFNEKSLGAQIVTSKSSEMNVSVPAGEDDTEEIPVPEQFITTYDPKTKKLNTTHVSHF